MSAHAGLLLLAAAAALAAASKEFMPNDTPLAWWHYDGKSGIRAGKGHSGTHVAFQDHVFLGGWGHLHVNAEATKEGAYAAGFLEGYMTSVHIFEHYVSWLQAQFGEVVVHAGGNMRNFGGMGRLVRKFVDANDIWVREQVAKHPDSEYWQTVGRLMAQVDGLLAGQTAATVNTSAMTLERGDLLLLLASGDVYDIQPAVHEAGRVNWAALRAQDFMKEFHKRVSCSCLVTATGEAVRAGHNTWTSYNNMLRIYKRFTWTVAGRPVHQVAFSSRPAYTYSKDDFYTLPLQRMVVMETTNSVFNNSLYDKVIPRALMAWQRVPVSNFLARDGTHWADLMTHHNSGTYNNQWIAVTLDRATKTGLQDGFLTIAEQIPGEVKVADVTPIVRQQGFWASYNVPYDAGIWEKSGYGEHPDKMGGENSYHGNARAKIFQRDAPGARRSMADFRKLMGSNNYQTDPFSEGDPNKAISARGDLSVENPSLFGAVDLKVTEFAPGEESWDGTAWARSGPTTDNQPAYSWLNIPDSEQILHLGQPAIFDFPFVPMAFSDASGIKPLETSGLRKNSVQWLEATETATKAERPSSSAAAWAAASALCLASVVCGFALAARAWRRRPEEEGSLYYLQS